MSKQHKPEQEQATTHPLKQGEAGDEVMQLQQQLGRIGYHDIDRKLHADGVFGKRTRNAVEAFQYDYGLVVDGVAGNKTQTALKHAERRQQHLSVRAFNNDAD
ncbi:peptidoglycan-binding domain-containing protein [Dyella sp. M7H15-1]|uniref:peptidoglycan-binding domain-containing protein n=1 Tax=Dyella sp. M7H15-1 TaxID=2501295 RepID=UPI0013E8F2A5|nr:peptidoglycan-binding domain-containing protein [Dyella sp. M7H15-1]